MDDSMKPETPEPQTGNGISRRGWLGVSAAAALSLAIAPNRLHAEDVASDLANTDLGDELAQLMSLASVPGVAVANVKGKSVDATGYGMTRAETGKPVNADTVFEAASLSKPVFAYLVHLLALEGKIDLDRPLREYLALPNPSDARAATITASHVLSHTSGWRNWRFGKDDVLTADFDPGARFSYSGEGYYFLQRVVEKITGKGILRITRERIFEPLGMTRTSYMWAPEFDTSRAEPHSGRGIPIDSFNAALGKSMRDAAKAEAANIDDWKHEDFERTFAAANKERPPFPNFLAPNVAGSMHTTAGDYGKFLAHIMSAGTSAMPGKRILDRMMTPKVEIKSMLKWGLGFGLETGEIGGSAKPLFWHWGDNNGFKNIVIGDPAASSAIVVLTNSNNGRTIYERVVRRVRGKDQPAFLWI